VLTEEQLGQLFARALLLAVSIGTVVAVSISTNGKFLLKLLLVLGDVSLRFSVIVAGKLGEILTQD
jgi:hypothetical protein